MAHPWSKVEAIGHGPAIDDTASPRARDLSGTCWIRFFRASVECRKFAIAILLLSAQSLSGVEPCACVINQ